MIKKFDKEKIIEIIEITIGTLLVAIGFHLFLDPMNLVTGGVMGLVIILSDKIAFSSEVYKSIILYVMNGTILLLALLFLGKKYFYKTVYATLLLPTILLIFELTLANDFITSKLAEGPLLLTAIFSALFTGVGLGLVIRNNASTGGMDAVQNIMQKFLKIPFSIAMYMSDGIIILIGISVFGIERGLYAIAALFLIGFIADRVMLSGRSGYTVFIVTTEYEAIKEAIYTRIDRGITKLEAFGGYSGSKKDIVICTINKKQLYLLKEIIKTTDPGSFSFVTRTSEAIGHGFSNEQIF